MMPRYLEAAGVSPTQRGRVAAFLTALLVAAFHALSVGADEPFVPQRPFSVFAAATGHEIFSTRESVYEAYRSREDFIARWPRDDTCDDSCIQAVAAQIDFAQEMVLLIAPRGRGQDTYDVVVRSVEMMAGALEASFIELRHGEPGDGVLCGILTVMPQPAVALLVPQNSAPVRFLRRRADVICEHDVEVNRSP